MTVWKSVAAVVAVVAVAAVAAVVALAGVAMCVEGHALRCRACLGRIVDDGL
ncbi:hypothetical protein [Pandoraea anhela]|uniref:hypothetical protein n=1 Tax=Pandoraea anhela TaxID=2508295 RepID=UPI001583A9D4|nr:hypothetical protein [Pandoraea anhela]